MSKNVRGKINPSTGLTEKEQQFALSYVANEGNVTQASKQIGISRVTATAYLKKQRVIDFLETLGESAGEDVLTAQEVLVMLSKIAKGEIKHQMINVKTGQLEWVEDVHAKNNSLKQLARCYGMEKQVIEETKTVINVEFEDDEFFDDEIIDIDFEPKH